MKHLDRIRSYISTLCQSEKIHALVLLSPPGFAKSTTIDQALKTLGIDYVPGGSYATPLHIYNLLCEYSNATIVLDDCSGIFEDVKAMSVLKAASWAAAKDRVVAWGSTSDKVKQPSTVFRGKLILIANAIPRTREAQAFLSRAIFYEMGFSREDVTGLLRTAANSNEFFPNTKLASEVAEFLIQHLTGSGANGINLRTLHIGCEIASTHPNEWRELMEPLLPLPNKDTVVESLVSSSLPAKEQEVRFMLETGFSRRTFYNHKKRLGLSRIYHRSRSENRYDGPKRDTSVSASRESAPIGAV